MDLLSSGSAQSYFYLFEGLGINSQPARRPGGARDQASATLFQMR
jgi:hypothetical protein